jgi:ABC-type multidrug transport system fused ATPase/permease subunit
VSPVLSGAFLRPAPAGWLLLRRHVRRTVQRGTGYQRAQADVAARLMDALAGSRTIAAAGTVEQEIERVLRPVPELSRHGYGLWDSQRRVAFSTGLLAPATQIAVLAAAGHCLSRGTVSTGELVAALGYTALADAPLSGGQRQRLGLARALAPDCRLLVLDDATSSLDTATEARLLAAMNVSHRGRTRLVVTRRTSLAAQADAVAWLEDGRIRALAPHHRLWRIPAYRRIFTGTPTEP